MIHVEVRCTICKSANGVGTPMVCMANIKIVDDGSIAHVSFVTSLGGIYKCPKCGKTVDIQIKEK